MCRMFGAIAARAVASRELLRDAPRSLRALSREHKDGWGIAIHGGDDWVVERSTACAAECGQFDALTERLEARLIIAHVRQKTVGPIRLANTHPFRRGALVFAHNGTVKELAAVTARCSPERLAEVEGDTDSERLFGYVLTHIDELGDVERGVSAAVRALHALGDPGSTSFLLSCGVRLYVHRLGRSLFALIRHQTTEQRRTAAVVIASEQLTGEAWRELPERALVVVDDPTAGPRTLNG